MAMFERFALRGGGSVRVSVTEEREAGSLKAVDSAVDSRLSVFKLRDGTVLDRLGEGMLQDPRNGERYALLPV